MNISIIGTGNMGRAIATRAATGHHEIQVVDRDRGHAEALAQELQQVIPASKVVKGFTTVFAGTLVAGEVAGEKLDVFLAADDAEAKDAVATLVESAGMRAIDAGPLKRAHQLEGLGFLHMAVQGQLGNTWSTAVKIIGA